MKLNIYTRCYVKPDGYWDLCKSVVDSVLDLVNRPFDRVEWILLISNFKNLKPHLLDELKSKDKYGNITFLLVDDKLSAGEAREYIYNWVSDRGKDNLEYDSSRDYYMNIDSDDELINIPELSRLSLYIFDADLIGFGLVTDKPSDKFTDEYYPNGIHNQWHFDKDYFLRSRRNVINATQSMFLFIHKGSFIEELMKNRKYFTKSDGNEDRPTLMDPCEDTLVALDTMNMIKSGIKVNISAIDCNFIKYTIREDSISSEMTDTKRSWLKDKFKELGYLKVNHDLMHLGNVSLEVIDSFNKY